MARKTSQASREGRVVDSFFRKKKIEKQQQNNKTTPAADLGRVGDHRLLAGRPVRRADFPVLAHVLEGLNQAQGFIHRAPDRQVVNRDLLQDALHVYVCGKREIFFKKIAGS